MQSFPLKSDLIRLHLLETIVSKHSRTSNLVKFLLSYFISVYLGYICYTTFCVLKEKIKKKKEYGTFLINQVPV